MNQENMPLVTAIIPVYNHEKYVAESIRSIIQQTYRNIELIVINDGSSDKSHERVLALVEECKQRFVRFEYINRENIGVSATLNQALSMARGEYLTVHDSDDIALPERTALLVDALEAKDHSYAAAFGNALFIDEKSRRVRLNKHGGIFEDTSGRAYDNFVDFYMKHRHFNYKGENFGSYKTLVVGNYLPSMSSIVRTAAISEVGGWTARNVIEDWEMWLKLSKKFKLLYVDQPMALYRWHDSNTAKTMVGGLTGASLLLIDKEKDFCAANNLISVWRRSHNSLVCDLLLSRRSPLNKKLSILNSSDKISLLLFAVRRLAGRCRRYGAATDSAHGRILRLTGLTALLMAVRDVFYGRG